MKTVFLACPTYGQDVNFGTSRSILQLATERDDVQVIAEDKGGSLIPGNCNWLWCRALNVRKEMRIDYFAMLHADVQAEPYWLDKLISLAERERADMIAANVPLKDENGLTSTAIAGEGDNQFGRFTLRQLWHEGFPRTFDINHAADALESLPEPLRVNNVPRIGLRLNTGCMLVRFDRPWIGCDPPQVFFDNPYWIEKYNGEWRARDFSEDWRFSKKIQDAGGRLVATSEVRVHHVGMAHYPNFMPPGSSIPHSFRACDCPKPAPLESAA